MLPLAYFGIESNAFNLVIDLLILFVAVLYCALIYWTYADARRRIEDPMMIGLAVVVGAVPVRGGPDSTSPCARRSTWRTCASASWRRIAAEARLHQLDYGLCPHCDYPIEREFVRCPSCCASSRSAA